MTDGATSETRRSTGAMESNDDKPDVVDLLYDDELDEETTDDLSEARPDESSARGERLESYESMLSTIREHATDEEVPDELHESIVDQAREETQRRVEDQTRPDRPATPPPSNGEPDTLWGRFTGSTTPSQLGIAAAAVLAVGASLYVWPTTGPLTQKSQAPASKEADPVSARQDYDEEAPSSDPDENSVGEVQETTEPGGEASPPSPGTDKSTPAEGKRAESARSSDKESPRPAPSPVKKRQAPSGRAGETSGDDGGTAARNRIADSSETSKSKKSAGTDSTKSSADSDESLDFFDSKSRSKGTNQPAHPDDSKKAKVGSKTGNEETEPSDNAGIADMTGGSKTGTGNLGKKQKQESSNEPTASDVETSYDEGAWQKTVERADEVLGNSDADGEATARVMELKARALENQGDTQAAYDIYEDIADQFPSYKTDDIQEERARLKKELTRSRPKASGDKTDDESTADEADEVEAIIAPDESK